MDNGSRLKAALGYFVARVCDYVARNARVLFVVLLSIYAVWSCVGLLESPGFTTDEAPIIVDAGLHYARHGFLAVPAMGPGFGHEEAVLYQTPLHFLALGYVFRVFGEGLLQARLLSVALALCCLCVLFLIVRRWSPLGAFFAAVLLAVDPLFTARTREARYDWLALLGALGAFGLLISMPSEQRRRIASVLAAGVLVGLAVNSHVLSLIYGVIFGLLLLLPSLLGPRKARFRWMESAVFSLGVVVTLVPFLFYASRHPTAFVEQFLHQSADWHKSPSKTGGWLYQEALKYFQYYRLAPFGFIYFVGSMCVAGWLACRSSSEGSEPEGAGTLARLRTVFLITLLGIGLLSVISGHRPWRLLLLAPFVSAVGGMVAVWAAKRARDSWPALFLCLLFCLAVLNGVAANWLARTYSAFATWGERRVDKLEARLTELIPRGSSVYGDYRLVFLACKLDWKFVQHQDSGRRDPKRIREMKFDYLVVSEMTGDLNGINTADYVLVEELKLGRSPFRLKNLNKTVVPIDFQVYRRVSLLAP